MKKYTLYKAVKFWIAQTWSHMTLPELWKIVNNKVYDAELSAFMKNEVIELYFEEV